jgi:hypothetical protein
LPEEDLQKAIAVYRANLTTIIDTCRAQKQDLAVVTQPTIYRADLASDAERLTWSWMDEGAYTISVLEQLMKSFNQATVETCAREGVDCIDLASQLPKDTTIFFDDVHFTDLGCQKAADTVCDYFANKLKGSN